MIFYYPDATELLTESGWVQLDQLDGSNKVLCLSDDLNLCYRSVEVLTVKPFDTRYFIFGTELPGGRITYAKCLLGDSDLLVNDYTDKLSIRQANTLYDERPGIFGGFYTLEVNEPKHIRVSLFKMVEKVIGYALYIEDEFVPYAKLGNTDCKGIF